MIESWTNPAIGTVKPAYAMLSFSERLRQQVSVMERDLMLGKKQAESDRRDIENQKREKDILLKNMQKIQSSYTNTLLNDREKKDM